MIEFWKDGPLTKDEYDAWLESLDRREAEALFELEENDYWRDVYTMMEAGIPSPLESNTKRDRLKRIEWKIRHGRSLELGELGLVADGIAQHLADPKVSPWGLGDGKKGRPESTRPPVEYWRDVATVHFYRLLLPALDGRKPVSWEWLALELGKSDRKTLPPLVAIKRPTVVYGPTPNPYDAKMKELVRAEGLEGVVYILGHLYRPA